MEMVKDGEDWHGLQITVKLEKFRLNCQDAQTVT